MKGLEHFSCEERMRVVTVQHGGKKAQGDLIHGYKYLKVQRGQGQALLSSAQWQDQRQWTQTETQEVPSEHLETPFHCADDQPLEQAAQRGYGFSILGHFQKLSGHVHGQSALSDSDGAWSESSNLNHSVILWQKNEHNIVLNLWKDNNGGLT